MLVGQCDTPIAQGGGTIRLSLCKKGGVSHAAGAGYRGLIECVYLARSAAEFKGRGPATSASMPATLKVDLASAAYNLGRGGAFLMAYLPFREERSPRSDHA